MELWRVVRQFGARAQVIIVGATRTGAVSAFLRKHMNNTQATGLLACRSSWPVAAAGDLSAMYRSGRSCLWLPQMPTCRRHTWSRLMKPVMHEQASTHFEGVRPHPRQALAVSIVGRSWRGALPHRRFEMLVMLCIHRTQGSNCRKEDADLHQPCTNVQGNVLVNWFVFQVCHVQVR